MPILNWLNRDKTIKESAKVPYRLLKAKDEYSYGDKNAENKNELKSLNEAAFQQRTC